MSSPRKHLNPAVEAAPGLHPTRRAGGARRELSDRVVFRFEGREVDGWALNASRSGLRAIVEEVLPLGAELDVAVGEAAARPGRVVWLQEEKDGAIVGISFLDDAARAGSIPDLQGGAASPGVPASPEPGPAPDPSPAGAGHPGAGGSAPAGGGSDPDRDPDGRSGAGP